MISAVRGAGSVMETTAGRFFEAVGFGAGVFAGCGSSSLSGVTSQRANLRREDTDGNAVSGVVIVSSLLCNVKPGNPMRWGSFFFFNLRVFIKE